MSKRPRRRVAALGFGTVLMGGRALAQSGGFTEPDPDTINAIIEEYTLELFDLDFDGDIDATEGPNGEPIIAEAPVCAG